MAWKRSSMKKKLKNQKIKATGTMKKAFSIQFKDFKSHFYFIAEIYMKYIVNNFENFQKLSLLPLWLADNTKLIVFEKVSVFYIVIIHCTSQQVQIEHVYLALNLHSNLLYICIIEFKWYTIWTYNCQMKVMNSNRRAYIIANQKSINLHSGYEFSFWAWRIFSWY